MEIGTEISQKIRSAIKAKLIELGAYVDDELPDYIMVMVANKKTQKQMTDDLSLFLNTNTEKFTSWLHSLLKKLQAINTDSPPGKHKHKEKDRQKGEKRKHKSSHSEKTHKSTDAAKQPKTSVTENKAGTKKKETEYKEKEKKEQNIEEPVTSATKPVSPTPPAAEDVAVDEINIIENTDEFNEENKEIEKTQSKKASKPPDDVGKTENGAEVKKPSAKVSTREEKVSSKSRSASSSSQKSKDEGKAVRKKPISFVASVKRKYVEEEEEYDPLNPAVGSVASVVRGPTRKSSVPKSLQANKSLLMKAVSDAEKSVTTSKKTDLPSPSEPQKPAMRSDRKPVDLSRRLKTAAGLQLISRSKRKEMLQELKYTVDNDPPQEPVKKQRRSTKSLENMKYTVKNEVKSPTKKTSPKTKSLAVAPSRVAATALRGLDQQSRVNSKKVQEVQQAPDTPEEEQEEKSVDEEQYGPALPDTRLVQQKQLDTEDEVDEELTPKAMTLYDEDLTAHAASESCSDAGTDPEVQKILEETEDTEIELTDETGNYWQEEENKRIIKKDRRSPADPKFIVTLDGVDPTTYRVLPEPRKNVVQTVVPVQKYEPAKVVEDIADQVKAAVESEEMYSKITPPKIKPFNINLKDTDDEEESEEIAMDTQEIQKSPVINEKCRFWPACANGNACQFIHPSIPCKTFPYCKFGDKCMYIHPNCKFDASCTRMDCPYTHATRRGGGFNKPTVIHQIVQVPVQKSYMPSMPQSAGLTAVQAPSIECKFFPNCHNMNCPFTHPKPCRYGIGCMNKSTCSFHHPPLPTMNKLKWTSSDKKETMGQPISISSSLPK